MCSLTFLKHYTNFLKNALPVSVTGYYKLNAVNWVICVKSSNIIQSISGYFPEIQYMQ
jgi:hypothetical protein